MNIAVLYRAKGSTFWHDITRYLATTSKEILSWDHNIQNKLFEFDLEFWNPLDNDSDYIYIDTGAEIAVTNKTYTQVYGEILAGRVEKVSLPFDKGINESTIYEHNLAYKVTIQNHNFSVTDLSLSFEDILNLSELLNDNILLNAPLGGVLSSGEVIPKVILSSDIEIEPLNLEGSELDTLITALNQVGYLFQVKYRVEYDATNTINLIQYLKIFESLTDNTITDTWSTGLNVRQYRNGVIFVGDNSQIAESKLVYNKDASPVRNSLTLNFLVKDPNLSAFYKRSLGGEDLFYIGKAYDVKYVALYIDTTVSSVISSTVLELPHDDILKMRADQTRLDDNNLGGRMTARITNGSTITFINFTVDASLDRVTLDSALTVSSVDRFELVNCFDILEENLEEYPIDGYVQKHIKPSEDSYVKFFKYDMPRTGQDIVIWYYPVNDSPIRETFEDSIRDHGLRTLRENLNDIFVSETQSEQLFNEYKKLKDPLETISFESQRTDLLNVGRSISVNFGDINKTFTVTEAKTSILNDDSNKIIQNIKLSSYINNLQTIIAKLRNQNKLKDIKANVKNKVSFSSTLAIITSAVQGIMNGISAPEALPATSITTDTFILNYNVVSGAIAYKADLSTSPTFDTFLSGWNNKGIGVTGYYLVNGLSALSGPFYYRVRAIDSYGNTSANSEVITVNKGEERILFMRGTDASITYDGNLYSCKLDGSDLQQHTITERIYIGATFIKNGDIVYSRSNGTENKLYIIKKSESYSTEYELLDSLDNPLPYNNQQVKASNNLNKIAYYKEDPPSTTDLYIYDLDSKIETALETAPDRYYLPYWDSTDSYLYLMTINSGDTTSNIYIKKCKLSDGSITTVVNNKPSLFPVVDSSETYLFYAYNSSGTYSDDVDRIRRYKLDGSEDIDIINTGTTTYYSMGIDSNSNKLYFCNKRSPHTTKFQLYKANIDGTSQDLVFGSTVAYNDYFMDLKEII